MDQQGKNLCPVCKEKYKLIHQNKYIDCDNENYKKCEKNRHSVKYEVCFDCYPGS